MSEQLLVLREAGLADALKDLVDRVADDGPACVVEATQSGRRPPWDVEVAVLRIVQEAVTNVLVHSSADSMAVRLDVQTHRVNVQIEDDGVGIDSQGPMDASSHLGVRGMYARAHEVGASVVVGPGLASGTIVRFCWPA